MTIALLGDSRTQRSVAVKPLLLRRIFFRMVGEEGTKCEK
jgi:hypothetical protein